MEEEYVWMTVQLEKDLKRKAVQMAKADDLDVSKYIRRLIRQDWAKRNKQGKNDTFESPFLAKTEIKTE